MIVFLCCVSGGLLAQWGIEGRITATDMTQLAGPVSPQGQTVEGAWQLIQANLVDRGMIQMHFLCTHNRRPQVQLIIHGMAACVLRGPTLRGTGQNAALN